MFFNGVEMNGREKSSFAMASCHEKANIVSIDDPVSVPRTATSTTQQPKRGGTVDCCGDECPIMCLCPGAFFEYETPKVVTVKNIPLGILRLLLQVIVIVFVVFYQLWYARGYQEFAEVEASVTTKVKGFSRSILPHDALPHLSMEERRMYERVWDESDYVIPPAENSAFFVMTNLVITPNQTIGTCPEDHTEMKGVVCGTSEGDRVNITEGICVERDVKILHKGHGEETGNCVMSDRDNSAYVCEIDSWCPVEFDAVLSSQPLIPGAENYTVLIKNSVSFSRFGEDKYHKNNMPNGICIFKKDKPETHLCPIFKLGDIVELAGGNFSKIAIKGGVISIQITWNCDLDWNFDEWCLPKYNFRVLDNTGWNFRHAHYHEESRRTLIKAYGLKFLLVIDGRASKFDLKNTVIVLVTGLGLLGLSTMFCDFVLLNYSADRKKVKEKKYETVDTTSRMLSATMNIIGHTSLLNMKVGGSQTSGSNLKDQQPQKNSGSSQKASSSSTTNNTKASSQNLKSTIVLEEDEKAIS